MDDREYEFLKRRHHDLMRRAQEAIEQSRLLRRSARSFAQGEKARNARSPDRSESQGEPADPVAEGSPAGAAKSGKGA
ncbi:hypothetical protein J2851_002246 [Azospirillum rugosum]|uniref:Uncharacterized protein n=1 Tax=Azospirillum rugosum TaxID=416170 RepID=A0ABS4SIU0_9PROT|nr:hypothetical protein [Azospirillum rugosum]MDQ0526235.1 hypothetical protein [Azospirillum rugosum]